MSSVDTPTQAGAAAAGQLRGTRPIPSPKAWPLIGHLPYLSKGRHGCFHDALARIARVHGPLFKLRIGGQTWYVVTDGPLAKDLLATRKGSYPKGKTLAELRAFGLGRNGLTFSEGDAWLAQRRLLNPLFTPASVPRLTAKMPPHLDRFCALVGGGATVEILDAMSRLSMATLFDVFVSEPTGCLNDLTSHDPLIARQRFAVQQLVLRIKRTPLWKHLPLPANARVRTEVAAQRRYWQELVDRRRASAERPADLLSYLLAADEGGGAALGDADLIDQLQTFLGASYESVSVCLHWLFYYLAVHPDVERQVHAELMRFDAAPTPAGPESYTLLDYLQQVIKETMRLRPVFPFIAREVAAADELDGYRLEQGALIFFLTEVMQTDPAVWGDRAGEFRPERFAKDASRKAEMTSYYPFGIGSRYCIGHHLAMQMVSLVAATLVRAFRFELLPNQDVSPVYRFTWTSVNGIRLRLTRR